MMKLDLQTFQSLLLAILFVALYIAEHVIPQINTAFDRKHDFVNVLTGFLNLTIVFSGGYFLEQVLVFCRAEHFGLLNMVAMPLVLNIILQIILTDLVMYWWHRINHLVPFFWRFHRFHHSDTQMNSTTTLRFHPIEQVLSSLMKFALFPLLGISVAGVLAYGFLFFPVIQIHHSNIRVTEKLDHLYRRLFVSPLMHRTHHSRIKKETDSNYGSVFPFWDRFFNSYTAKASAPVDFGIE